MSKTLTVPAFGPSEGRIVNAPTWDVCTILCTEDLTRRQIEVIAIQDEGVRMFHEWFDANMERFVHGTRLDFHAHPFSLLFAHWVTDPCRHIPWMDLSEALQRGDAPPTDPLLQPIYQALQPDWEAVLVGWTGGPDVVLRDWIINHTTLWVENEQVRQAPGRATGVAIAILNHYYNAVDWEAVVSFLRGA